MVPIFYQPASAPTPSYRDRVRAKGPVAYYPLSETGGATTAVDLANQNHGTIAGAPTQGVAGPAGTGETAMLFDGVDACVTAPNTPRNNLTRAVSVAVWIKMPSTLTGWLGVVAKSNATVVEGWAIRRHDNFNTMQAAIAGPSIGNGYYGDWADLANDQWHLLVASYDGARIKTWRDRGTLFDDWASTGDIVSAATRLLEIGRLEGGSFWSGSIAQAAVFDYGLTQADAIELYDAGSTAAGTTVVARTAGRATLERTLVSRLSGLAKIEKLAELRLAGRATLERLALARAAGVLLVEAVRGARAAGRAVLEKTVASRTAGVVSLSAERIARTAGRAVLEASRGGRLAGRSALEKTTSSRAAGLVRLAAERVDRLAGRAVIEASRGGRAAGLVRIEKLAAGRLAGTLTLGADRLGRLAGRIGLEASTAARVASTSVLEATRGSRTSGLVRLAAERLGRTAGAAVLEKSSRARVAGTLTLQTAGAVTVTARVSGSIYLEPLAGSPSPGAGGPFYPRRPPPLPTRADERVAGLLVLESGAVVRARQRAAISALVAAGAFGGDVEIVE